MFHETSDTLFSNCFPDITENMEKAPFPQDGDESDKLGFFTAHVHQVYRTDVYHEEIK